MLDLVVFRLGWLLMLLSWMAAAMTAKRIEKRDSGNEGRGARGCIVLGFFTLMSPRGMWPDAARLWQVPAPAHTALLALLLAGFAFSWWARLHLGRYWSGAIAMKADHKLIDTGPYALVRHPMYFGGMMSGLATAAARGDVPGVLGFAVMVAGFIGKARVEERFLSAELGRLDYAGYQRRVRMILPGVY